MFNDGSLKQRKEGEDDQILKLSDAFAREGEDAEADIEARVRMININYGNNESLLASCKPLKEYAWLVDRIRTNQEAMGIEEAVDRAMEEMPEDFAIRQFLIGHKAEVKDLCITEYNEAETMQMIREEGREEGDLKRAMKTASKMFTAGEPIDKIAGFLEFSPETILSWVGKS